MAAQPALRGHPARERGRIKTGNHCPGLGDPPRLLPHHCCQRSSDETVEDVRAKHYRERAKRS